jgi:hypothetical protein
VTKGCEGKAGKCAGDDAAVHEREKGLMAPRNLRSGLTTIKAAITRSGLLLFLTSLVGADNIRAECRNCRNGDSLCNEWCVDLDSHQLACVRYSNQCRRGQFRMAGRCKAYCPPDCANAAHHRGFMSNGRFLGRDAQPFQTAPDETLFRPPSWMAAVADGDRDITEHVGETPVQLDEIGLIRLGIPGGLRC